MSARDSLVILSTKILIKIIGIITIYFASRVFLPEYFGLITIATSLFSFFEFFADLVFRSTHLKLMSRGDEDENILYSTYFYIKIILITLVSLITFILIQVNLNGGHVENVKLLYQVIEIYFIKSILTSYNQILSNTFLSKKKIIKMQFPFIMNSISVGILKLLAVLLFNDFLLYCFALIIGEIIHLILNSYYGKKFKLKRSNMDIFKKYLKPTSILMINGFISLCLSNIGPLIFVKYYSIDMLGVYNIIKSSFSIVFIVQQALTALYIPRFSSLIAKGELKELQMRTDAYEKYMLILWGILMIFGFLVGPVIIKLFFGEFYYNNGVDLLFFLIFQAFSWGLTGLAGSVFIASDDEKIYSISFFIHIIVAIITWTFILPKMGILGIEMNKFIGNIIVIPLNRIILYKRYNLGRIQKKSILLVIINLIFGGICYIIFKSLIYQLLLINGLISIGLFAIYILLLFLVKILHRDDVKFVFNLINPRSNKEYIVNGLKKD